MELRSCLVEDTHSYLSAIMNAAQGLPPTVVAEIREEVETRLQARVASTLSDVLQQALNSQPDMEVAWVDVDKLQEQVDWMVSDVLEAAENGGCWDGGKEEGLYDAEVLSQQYAQLLRTQLQTLTTAKKQGASDGELSNMLGEFSRALLGAPDIRREIEPLVAFLVIFAKSQDTDRQSPMALP